VLEGVIILLYGLFTDYGNVNDSEGVVDVGEFYAMYQVSNNFKCGCQDFLCSP